MLREALADATGTSRIRFTPEPRRRLAGEGKTLSPKEHEESCQIVRPATILAWFRRLTARTDTLPATGTPSTPATSSPPRHSARAAPSGLIVFFVIELRTRAVHVAGIRIDPDGGWMQQVARQRLDATAGFLRYATHLIHDRDPLFTAAWTTFLSSRRGVMVATRLRILRAASAM